MSLNNMFCKRCEEGFEPSEKIVNTNGELWHTQCFVYVDYIKIPLININIFYIYDF